MRYRTAYGRVEIRPDSFFFQEGRGEEFSKARYAEFKCDASGRSLLTALLDENLTPIATEPG